MGKRAVKKNKTEEIKRDQPGVTESVIEPKIIPTAVIKWNSMRFLDQKEPKIIEILEDISKQYSVKLNILPMRNDKNMWIQILGENEDTNLTVKFLIEESLSTQKSLSFKMKPKDLENLFKKIPRPELTFHRVVDIKRDFKNSILNIVGGIKSVEAVTPIINEYILWSTQPHTRELELCSAFNKFMFGKNFEEIKQITAKCGRYVEIVPSTSSVDLIIVSGLKSHVNKATDIIKEIYKDVSSKLTFKSYKLTYKQYTEDAEIFKETDKFSFLISIKCKPLDEKLYLIQMVGTEESINKISKIIDSTAEKFPKVCFETQYWIYLSIKHNSVISEFLQVSDCEIGYDQKDCTLFVSGSKNTVDYVVVPMIEEKIKSTSKDNLYDYFILAKYDLELMEECEGLNLASIQESTSTIIWISSEDKNNEKNPDSSASESEIIVGIVGTNSNIAKVKKILGDLLSTVSSYEKYTIGEVNNGIVLFGDEFFTMPDIKKKYAPQCRFQVVKNIESNKDECLIIGPNNQILSVKKIYKEKNKALEELTCEVIIPLAPDLSRILSQGDDFLCKIKKEKNLSHLLCTAEKSGSKGPGIIIKGRKEDIQEAEEKISDYVKELSRKNSIYIPIPASIFMEFSDIGDWITKAIRKQFYNAVTLTYPPKVKAKSKLSVYGLKIITPKVVDLLNNIYDSSQEIFLAKISISLKFINEITRTNSKCIQSLTDNNRIQYKIILKRDGGFIYIFGPASLVKSSIVSLNASIEKAECDFEKVLNIPLKYRDSFFAKKYDGINLLQKLTKEYENVRIQIESSKPESNTVDIRIRGRVENVDKILTQLTEMLKTWDSTAEIKVYVANSIINEFFKSKRLLLLEKMEAFKVDITVSQNFFDSNQHIDANPNAKSQVTIRGKQEDVDKFASYILCLEIILTEIECEYYHQKILGNFNSKYFKTLKYDYLVTLIFGYRKSPPENKITIKGLKDQVDKAIDFIYVIQKKYSIFHLDISPQYYGRIIGKGGSNLKNLCKIYNGIEIIFPDKNDLEAKVAIIGKKEDCKKAADDLMETIQRWDDVACEKIELTEQIREELKKEGFKTIEKSFTVSLFYDRHSDLSQNEKDRVLYISGDINNVKKCSEYLSNKIEAVPNRIEKKITDRSHEFMYELDLSTIKSFKTGKKNKKKQKDVLLEDEK
ncbi:hypothetical protein HZS_5049 [Henneguya salminicola]|nr:hypothetical protein HZS_5049 [Henneguya salminicola]